MTEERRRGLIAQLIAYLAALAVGAVVLSYADLGSRWLEMLAADAAATAVVFAFSVGLGNSSLYDPYWSVAPPVMGAVWIAMGTDALRARAILALTLTFVWGARLTFSFFRGWPGLGHEDWRYRDLRKKTGKAYWLVSLLGIHYFPTALTFGGSLALFAAIDSDAPFSILDGVAAALTMAAIAIETRADRELRDFLRAGPGPGSILSAGLWAQSRHPNYLGEILFWWGLALFAVAGGATLPLALGGASAITLLFVFVSVPMIERHMAERRPGWAEHRRKVPVLLPTRLFTRRSRGARDRGASPPR